MIHFRLSEEGLGVVFCFFSLRCDPHHFKIILPHALFSKVLYRKYLLFRQIFFGIPRNFVVSFHKNPIKIAVDP